MAQQPTRNFGVMQQGVPRNEAFYQNGYQPQYQGQVQFGMPNIQPQQNPNLLMSPGQNNQTTYQTMNQPQSINQYPLARSIALQPQIISSPPQMVQQQTRVVNVAPQSSVVPVSRAIQAVQYAQPQQSVYEIHQVERPLEVITIDEIENPWRLKCATLERQILELQIQLRKGGLPQIETVEVVDDSRIKALEKRLAELREIARFRDEELERLNQQIQEMQIQIEEVTTTKISYLSNEIETWRKKYKELQGENTKTQDELRQVDQDLNQAKREAQAQQASAQHQTTTTSVARRSSKLY